MTKTPTSAQKHNATKKAVVSLIQACGPCEMHEIIQDVKTQAYAGYLPKVMQELMQSLTIKFDAEDQAYEMLQ